VSITTTTNKITNSTLDKRNPPPLTVRCAPSEDEGPTVYTQAKEKKKNTKYKIQKQTVPRADKKKIPVGCQIFRRYVESKYEIRFV
jgi:hypothetical protein